LANNFVTKELALIVILSGELVAGQFPSVSSAVGSHGFEDDCEVKAVMN